LRSCCRLREGLDILDTVDLLVPIQVREVETRTRALSAETIVCFVNAMVICGMIMRVKSDRKESVVLSYLV